MGFTLILLITVIIIFMINCAMLEWPSLRALYMTRNMAGLRGLPIVGSIFVFLTTSATDILDVVENYLRIYPKRMCVYCGGVISVFLNEPEDVQVVLSSVDQIQKGVEYKTVEPWLNQGLLTSTGEKWRSRRKLLTPTFHFRILENAVATMNKKIDSLVENLNKTCGKVIQVDQWITRCTLDIIGESAMGIDLKAQKAEGNSYLQSVQRTTEAVILRILSVWQFKNWLFALSKNGRDFYKNVNILHDFSDKIIKEKKATHTETTFLNLDSDSGIKEKRAFLDCLIETQRTNPGSLSDLDIREEVDTFMFEGHDTTSAAVSFALWLLGTHVEAQDRVFAELKQILGDEDREVTMSDTHNMLYLEKVIKETLRLYPSVPFISRRLTQDLILDDGTVLPHTINTNIIPYLLHRNQRFFPDPEKFDPERFTEENSVGRHPFAYIPFSAGPRNCIGQKFAMLEMKMMLAKVLRRFSVKSVTRRDEFKILPYVVIRPTVPLKLVFSTR